MLSLIPFFLLLTIVAVEGAGDERNTFIVHVQPQANHVLDTADDRKALYQSFLPDQGQLLHAYHHVASGFAARLTQRELKAMSALPGFVAAVPDRIYKLHTTHTPQFLGLESLQGTRNSSFGFGDGVIIGVLDSGITPDHPSFSGAGMPPPPAKWKGTCDFNGRSVCNNKLIGARVFDTAGNGTASSTGAPLSPIDEDGHGTHTSSTAAGAVVPGAQVLGQGRGTASGIAPRAHVAMYKVCGEDCTSADILAGIDAAVADGCDIISMSLGGPSLPFHEDILAVGTFAAAEKGLFVSMSAGNSGPNYTTLSNEAPWMLTVAASTMDRLILAKVILGNGDYCDGESVYQPNTSSAAIPIVYAGASSTPFAQFCGNGSLDGFDVKGKIVLCERGNNVARIAKGAEVLRAGGAGMILTNQFIDGYSTLADVHVLPASHVSYADGVAIKAYISSTANPTAQISFKGTVLGEAAPVITSFSSRGPSIQNPGILKPDITGPGVSVLAAWPFQVGPPRFDLRPTYNIISGTSMSTPHLSGIAALIKSKHPDWSPAAIKSAIMTTADFMDHSERPILNEQSYPTDFFAIGAGHVNPEKAVDPGLVYDISNEDYIGYLCGLYTNRQCSVIASRTVDCNAVTVILQPELNYPSISVRFVPDWNPLAPVIVERTVKNVGEATAIYRAQVDMPAGSGVNVTVTPSLLWFGGEVQVQKFKVLVFPIKASATAVQGAIRWVSDTHTVRSPISATFPSH